MSLFVLTTERSPNDIEVIGAAFLSTGTLQILTKMRFKIVACILLILSVFNFVLAAPIPVREVRDACAKGGEDVVIVSRKRAPRGFPQYDESDSDTEWWTPESQSSSTSANQPASSSNPGPKTVQWVHTPTESKPSSPINPKAVTWSPAVVTAVFTYPKDPLPPPPGRNGYLAKVATQTLPQSKGFFSKLRTFFGNLASKLRFWPRF